MGTELVQVFVQALKDQGLFIPALAALGLLMLAAPLFGFRWSTGALVVLMLLSFGAGQLGVRFGTIIGLVLLITIALSK